MRRVRMARKVGVRSRWDQDRYGLLPLDPRDPYIVLAKQFLRRPPDPTAHPSR